MEPPVLVVTDGTPDSLGALRLARQLRERDRRPVHVLSVIEPLDVFGFDGGLSLPLDPTWERIRLRDHEARVRELLCEVELAFADLRTEAGPVALSVVRRAEEIGASLIICGLGWHHGHQRFAASDVVVKLIRLAHVPVLAVPGDAEMLPCTAVVAVDFSEYSLDAAHSALCVIGPKGELHLVHVAETVPHEALGEEAWEREYAARTEHYLERLAAALEPCETGQVHIHVLRGHPFREMIDLAAEVHAPLMAAGSHGRGAISRLVQGSMCSRLLRHPPGSTTLLIAPPRELPPEVVAELRELSEKEDAPISEPFSEPAHETPSPTPAH